MNTIPPHKEARLPGDEALLQRRIAYLRWNVMAMVVRANKKPVDPVDIGKTIHPHPIPGESVGMAAELFEGVSTDLPSQKK